MPCRRGRGRGRGCGCGRGRGCPRCGARARVLVVGVAEERRLRRGGRCHSRRRRSPRRLRHHRHRRSLRDLDPRAPTRAPRGSSEARWDASPPRAPASGAGSLARDERGPGVSSFAATWASPAARARRVSQRRGCPASCRAASSARASAPPATRPPVSPPRASLPTGSASARFASGSAGFTSAGFAVGVSAGADSSAFSAAGSFSSASSAFFPLLLLFFCGRRLFVRRLCLPRKLRLGGERRARQNARNATNTRRAAARTRAAVSMGVIVGRRGYGRASPEGHFMTTLLPTPHSR